MKQRRTWQKELKPRLQALAADMLARYEIKHEVWSGIRGLAYMRDGQRIINAPEVRGYVTFALLCHEISHHLLSHVVAYGKSEPMWKMEVSAWGLAKKFFDQYEINWVPSVQALVRSCLARMISEDLPEEEKLSMSKELKALQILEEKGL